MMVTSVASSHHNRSAGYPSVTARLKKNTTLIAREFRGHHAGNRRNVCRFEDLVAGLARNAELGAQRRHLLALEQAGDKPESLVHDVTLLPRHAPSWRGQSVTHPLGIRCYLSLKKDTQKH